MNKQKRTQLFLEFITDIFCLILANGASLLLFYFLVPKIPKYEWIEWMRYESTLLLSFLVVFFGYHRDINLQNRNRKEEFSSLFKNTSMTFMLFALFILLLKNPIIESRFMLLSNYIFFVLYSAIGRYLLKRYITGRFTHSRIASMVGVITTTDRADDFICRIKKNWALNVRGVVLLDNLCEDGVFCYQNKTEDAFYGAPVAATATATATAAFPQSINDVPVISTDATFMDWVRGAALDEVFINLPYADDSEVKDIVEELEDMGIKVHLNIPTLDDILDDSKFNTIFCHVQYGYPMATFTAVRHNPALLTIKRMTDVVLGTLGCLCSLPIIALTAIPLLQESKGPLIFKQKRVGKNGRFFYIYKLRSMYADADKQKSDLMKENKMDGLMFKMDDDPRITKVGKFIRKYSIDELPQFFNVVKGDMSLVGTRPPTVDEFRRYESRHKRRLSMRPGITGMWQVNGRSDIESFEKVVELDCEYIDKWSVWLDIKILFKTIYVVLFHKGAE